LQWTANKLDTLNSIRSKFIIFYFCKKKATKTKQKTKSLILD